MRYIIYSLVAVLIASLWLNHTADGRDIKQRLWEPAEGAPRVHR